MTKVRMIRHHHRTGRSKDGDGKIIFWYEPIYIPLHAHNGRVRSTQVKMNRAKRTKKRKQQRASRKRNRAA